MGNSQASTASASSSRFVTASRAFSKQELEGLRALFASLAAQSQTGGRAIFLEYCGVRGPLGERLFQLVAKESGGGDGITLEDLIISKATYVKGTRDEVEEFIHQLCDVTGDGILSRSDLESVLASIHEAIFAENKEAGKCSINRAFEASLNSALFSKDAEGMSEKSMSLSDFKNCCVLMPSLKKLLGNLLMPPDSVCYKLQFRQYTKWHRIWRAATPFWSLFVSEFRSRALIYLFHVHQPSTFQDKQVQARSY